MQGVLLLDPHLHAIRCAYSHKEPQINAEEYWPHERIEAYGAGGEDDCMSNPQRNPCVNEVRGGHELRGEDGIGHAEIEGGPKRQAQKRTSLQNEDVRVSEGQVFVNTESRREVKSRAELRCPQKDHAERS